jgi:hypothetical protein
MKYGLIGVAASILMAAVGCGGKPPAAKDAQARVQLYYEAPTITVSAKREKAPDAAAASAGVRLFYEAPVITVTGARKEKETRTAAKGSVPRI